jgi:hypothetical protein
MNLSTLENQLLFGDVFSIPSVDDDDTLVDTTFHWPRSIDGFAPDSYGSNFETYQEELLRSATQVDETKSNMLMRTVVGDNFVDLDSENQVFAKTLQAHSHQFDIIKQYIDNIAYAHTLNFSEKEVVPNKFLKKFKRGCRV